MSRKYSLDELDEMRRLIKRLREPTRMIGDILYSDEGKEIQTFNNIGYSYATYGYDPEAEERSIEQELRTLMQNGTDPEELAAKQAARVEREESQRKEREQYCLENQEDVRSKLRRQHGDKFVARILDTGSSLDPFFISLSD